MQDARRKLLNAALVGNLALSSALVVATLFLVATPYEGVDALLSAAVDVLFALVAIVILNKSPSAYSIGFLVGASLLVLVLSLQGALFWGLRAPDDVAHETAGIVACILHSVIFAVQAVVTWVVVKSREDVIDTYAAYEYIPDSGFADVSAYSNVRLGGSTGYQSNIPTADI